MNPNGSYAINIGQASHSGNWLPTTAQTTVLSIRETFNNWGTAVPDQLRLVRVDQTGPPLVHLSSNQMVAALKRASGQVIEEGAYWDAYWTALLSRLPANFVIPASATVGGLPTQISSLDHFDLAPGQALVINVPPDQYSAYQGLEVADVWGQTLPYAIHESSLNAAQAYLGSDGSYHFVISATDPGVPNWIDTDGHSEGFVFLRWQANTGPFTSADNPTGGLVSLTNLSSMLPVGTPKVTPAQRTIQLVLRDPPSRSESCCRRTRRGLFSRTTWVRWKLRWDRRHSTSFTRRACRRRQGVSQRSLTMHLRSSSGCPRRTFG